MDLENLKNLDVKDLVSKLKGSEIFSDKKTLTTFGIGFVAILISLIFYHFWISPVIKDQQTNINTMEQNKQQIEDFKMRISDLNQQVKDLQPEYEKNSKLFHNKKEVEDLHQSINNFALVNGLTIVSFDKKEPRAVSGNLNVGSMNENTDTMGSENMEVMQDESGNIVSSDAAGMEDEDGPVLYLEMPVAYEIQGTFLSYLKFRRALSKSLKVVNFDKEEINLLKEPQGQILSKLTISIVGLPNEHN
jgi:TolA-binding protein